MARTYGRRSGPHHEAYEHVGLTAPSRCVGLHALEISPMTNRRFPPPWRADKMPGGYVVRDAIRDANGQALVYLYSR